jgi:uncharacterized membrane protein YgcG
LQQQVLAQQLAANVDPETMRNLQLARSGYTPASGVNPEEDPTFRFAGARAVGYQPVIITLPEGVTCAVTAVISADRRYVRIAPAPTFMAIGQVHTFNTSTGEYNNLGQGGTGGQGFSGMGGGGMGGGF